MRHPFSRLRSSHVVAALILLPLAGWTTFHVSQRFARSPFTLWNLRAGMPFAKLENEVLRHGKRAFTCHVAIAPARLCELHVTGMPGRVRVLVDARDRAAIIQFLPDTASPTLREEGRRVAAAWSLVRAAETAASDRARKVTTARWSSANKKWTAAIRYGRLGATPIALELREQPAVKIIQSSAPLAPLVLVMNELIESQEVSNLDDLSDLLRPALFRQATDPASETPAPVAAGPQAPLCRPDADSIVPNADQGAAVSNEQKALLSQAIARAYPGSHLVFGQGTWLVDPTGRAERLVMHAGEFAGGGDRGISVFGIVFQDRYKLASTWMQNGRPRLFCSAPGEVLFVRTTDVASLAEVQRIPVDREAIASVISNIVVVPGSFTGNLPHLRLRYTGAYATERWTGSIEWEAVVAGNPPRTTVRVPLRFAQQAIGSEVVTSGMLLLTGRAQDAIELATVEQYAWGFATRSIRVPVDFSGALLGERLLGRLY